MLQIQCPNCTTGRIPVPEPLPLGRTEVRCSNCGQVIGLDNFPPAEFRGLDPNRGLQQKVEE